MFVTLSDIDVCNSGKFDGGVNADCVKNDGGYGCACIAGYSGDPHMISSDIDKCSDKSRSCEEAALCTNNVGA